MLKSLAIAASLAVIGATPALAQSWEAVSASDNAVAAVDWSSMRISGSSRDVTFAMVSLVPGAVPFDYAVSNVTMDCSQSHYATLRSQFFDRGGNIVVEDFIGDGTLTPVNDGTIMSDVRREVCSSDRSRKGYFTSAQQFATNAWAVAADGQ